MAWGKCRGGEGVGAMSVGFTCLGRDNSKVYVAERKV